MHDQPDQFQTLVLSIQRILHAHPLMTAAELAALEKWQSEQLPPNDKASLILWPGWEEVYRRLDH